MIYTMGPLPADAPTWMVRELRAIAEAIAGGVPFVKFDKLYAQPKKIAEGLTVQADGATWDPGSGAGVYNYRSGVWELLGGGGGGGLSAEDVDDRVAGLLVAGSNIGISYNDAANTLTVSATGGAHSLRAIVDFGAGWSDKAQTVVTGQAWVTADSEIVAQVLTPAGVDPDEMYLLHMRVEVSDLVAGVGFTVTAYSESEATGSYAILLIGS